MDEAAALVLAGTPIGDRDDASPALRAVLETADVIAAEDTRKFRDLCRRLEIAPRARVVSFFDGNEADRVAGLLEHLRAGRRVVVVRVFPKKTQKTPRREIELALKRAKEVL